MARPNDKKKGLFSRLRRRSPEEVDLAELNAMKDRFTADREEILDRRRTLKREIDRHTARLKEKSDEYKAASGPPQKKIIGRELAAIDRVLKGLIGEDDRVDARLTDLDSSLDDVSQAIIVKSSRIPEDDADILLDHKIESSDLESERRERMRERTEVDYEDAEEEPAVEDLLAKYGLDTDKEEVQETASPQAERETVQKETVAESDTAERITERKRDLDRLMAELDEDDE